MNLFGSDGYVQTCYQLHIRKEELPQKTIRLAYFTDLHNTADDQDAEEFIRILKAKEPDLVLGGGDMIVGKAGVSTEPAVSFLRKLSAHFPIYMGTGNHEYRTRIYQNQYGDMYERYRESLSGTEIVFLENRKEELEIDGIPVAIHGFDMKARYYKRIQRLELPPVEIREAIGVPDPAQVNILLAHNPAGMKAYLKWGADLTLCGHYHGGIMRLGKHHGLISPDLRPFAGNAYGLFQNDGKSVIVSSGCGEHTLPVRIRNPREIVFVDLHINGQG